VGGPPRFIGDRAKKQEEGRDKRIHKIVGKERKNGEKSELNYPQGGRVWPVENTRDFKRGAAAKKGDKKKWALRRSPREKLKSLRSSRHRKSKN